MPPQCSWPKTYSWPIDQTTTFTIATSLIHSKIDYCNSLLLNLPATQTNRLQLVLYSAARAVTKTHEFLHITPILKSLHWLMITKRIKYMVLSHINLSKLINNLTSALFFHSLHIVVLALVPETNARATMYGDISTVTGNRWPAAITANIRFYIYRFIGLEFCATLTYSGSYGIDYP